jgi:hypothetical protein
LAADEVLDDCSPGVLDVLAAELSGLFFPQPRDKANAIGNKPQKVRTTVMVEPPEGHAKQAPHPIAHFASTR